MFKILDQSPYVILVAFPRKRECSKLNHFKPKTENKKTLYTFFWNGGSMQKVFSNHDFKLLAILIAGKQNHN